MKKTKQWPNLTEVAMGWGIALTIVWILWRFAEAILEFIF